MLRQLWIMAVMTMMAVSTQSSQANFVVGVNNVVATAGSTGNTTLEVTLTYSATNTSPSPLISAFQFELSVGGSTGISFTDADISTTTAAYIFDTNTSTPPLAISSFPATTVTFSDSYTVISSGVSLNPGQTVGLGRFTFDVSMLASGLIPVVITQTSGIDPLVDELGEPILLPISYVNGSITIQRASGGVSTVPAPASLVLLLTSGIALVGVRRSFGR